MSNLWCRWVMVGVLAAGCGQLDDLFAPDYSGQTKDPFQLSVKSVMEPPLTVLRQYGPDKDAWLEAVRTGTRINDQPAKWATTVPVKDVLRLSLGETDIGYLVAPHGFSAWDLPDLKASSAFWQTFGYTVDGIPSGGLLGFMALSLESKVKQLPQAAPLDRQSPLAFAFTQEVPEPVQATLDALLPAQSQKLQQRNPWAGRLDPFPGVFEIRYDDQVIGYVSESFADGGRDAFVVLEALNVLDRHGKVTFSMGREVSPTKPTSYRRFSL